MTDIYDLDEPYDDEPVEQLPKYWLPDGVYDVLKWVALVACPLVAAIYPWLAEVWGLPTLYLPNRFADGVLKTSDAVYQLPVNEKAPYHNHIHGFLHKRRHTVVACAANETAAWARTCYIYNEEDPFFQYLPLPFTVEFFFFLSEYGLEYKVSIRNESLPSMLHRCEAGACPVL